jgi:predicted HTH domain antitoxin
LIPRHRVVYHTARTTLIIPDERIGNLKLDEGDVMTDIAIGLYKREQVSLGRAAEIAGLSSPKFLDELGRRRISINYDVNDLHADIATLGNAG